MDYRSLPPDLPSPVDDGSADHLMGLTIPSVPLRSTAGGMVDLSSVRGITIAYCYPMTGRPGVELPNGWDAIPGARGCTPQACAFRDHLADLRSAGAEHVFGVSSQSSDEQAEAADRLHLPFPLLSDEDLTLARALNLPIFACENRWLLKRLTLILRHGVIVRVFYPVFPPDRNALEVLDVLRAGLGSSK